MRKSWFAALALAPVLLLSACGQEPTGVVQKDPTTLVEEDLKGNSGTEVDVMTDETTGETFTEDDGPLDARTLDPLMADPTNTAKGCKDESVPAVVSRLSYDYDTDGVKDVAVVSRCGNKEYRVNVFRATSRGWWPKLDLADIDPVQLTGKCSVEVSKLLCEATNTNPVTDEKVQGVLDVYLLNGEWYNNFNGAGSGTTK
jgi:hypothetical protein